MNGARRKHMICCAPHSDADCAQLPAVPRCCACFHCPTVAFDVVAEWCLQYENSKLKQDNKVLSQQLQELRTVLLALESSNAATTQPPARKCQEHLIRQHGSMLGQENTLPRGTAALNGQQQQQQRVPSSKRPSIVQHGRNGTVAPGQPACLPASLGEADSIQDVELLNDDDGWLPDQQLAANSPRSDSSQLLDELLEDFTGANDSQQQQPQHIYKGNHQQAQPGAHAQQQGQQQPQQHQSTQPKQHQQHAHQPLAAERPAGSCWQGGSQAGLGVAALGPGSCLHPGPAKQVPSFMAKGKVGRTPTITCGAKDRDVCEAQTISAPTYPAVWGCTSAGTVSLRLPACLLRCAVACVRR